MALTPLEPGLRWPKSEVRRSAAISDEDKCFSNRLCQIEAVDLHVCHIDLARRGRGTVSELLRGSSRTTDWRAVQCVRGVEDRGID